MFNIFKGRTKKFITESQHNENLESQLSMSPQTVEQLREYGVKEDSKLKLEYFFYTNDSHKAEKLSNELSSIGYKSEFGTSADDKKLFIITGWSSPITMATQTVIEWTKKMCDLGFCNDCEFDGWGTNPEQ
jgi:regulator of RNase E activity RraB